MSELSPVGKAETLVEVEEEYIQIKETPTGWLNVRQGPGTDYEIMLKVNVGEEFLLMKEEDDWYKIKIDEGLEGWVFGDYYRLSDYVNFVTESGWCSS